AHRLIAEYWKNVRKGPVSVSDERSRKDRSNRNDVDRHATFVAETFLCNLPKNGIAENQKGCGHEKGADDNNGFALLRRLLFAKPQCECSQNKKTKRRGGDPSP